MIKAATSNEDQIFDWHQSRLQEAGYLFSVIAHERWLRTKNLQNERALLTGIDAAEKKSGSHCEPGCRS